MKTCIKCGSHAFNLYAEEIDQGGLCDVHYWQGRAHRAEALAQPEQEPVLQDIEQYRLQMAGISTAAIGYWKETDSIHRDYDTVALRDVAKLYAKYDALYKAQPEQKPLAKVEPCAVCGEGKARLSVLRSCDTCHSEYAGQAEMKVALGKPEQEPVAWIHNFIEGGISIGKRPSDLNRHPDRWTALYRESKPCPTCEALARTVMLDQTSHDTKRPWVGLTEDEIIAVDMYTLRVRGDGYTYARAIEDKLKEKNT